MNNRTSAQPQGSLIWPQSFEDLPSRIHKLGFYFFAFTFISSGQSNSKSNYPAAWLDHYKRSGYAVLDPVPIHCRTSRFPLLWDVETFKPVPKIWTLAKEYGLHHGWVQPIHDTQALSSLSILRPHVSVSREEFYEKAAQVMALGEQLHRAASAFFAGHHHGHSRDGPAQLK